MNDCNYQSITRRLEKEGCKVSRGKWNLEVTKETVQELEVSYNAPAAMPAVVQNLIPEKDDSFVKFGNFGDLKKIIQSRVFYPTFITGLSGNGKTFSVEQACAQLGRELIRVNITIETDEDDLIGGFRLVDGATVWHNGPVIEALERGAVLLLDEVDLASNKILCLQSILEGNGVFLKKIGKFVRPSAGFNVIATANTKGKGSDDGRFIGTNVLNEAFLERFPVTFEQEYPTTATETKILNKLCDDENFCKRLADWADIIRKTFYDGGIEEIISTRRLVHIVKAYSIFEDKAKAIQVCVNRFDDETKQAFLELYDKVDADFEMPIDEEVES
jgi:midasin (ATPase involved in ribosome maturation)